MSDDGKVNRLRNPLAGFLLILTVGLFLWFQRQPDHGIGEQAGAVEAGGDIEVFFSEPYAPSASSRRGGIDEHLAEAIRNARYSVDVAVLRLDLWSIRDALIEAHQRGVAVRVVTDDDYAHEEEIIDLLQAGIEVVTDPPDALMHHKFTIIDSVDVWTGSMNYTLNGAYRHDNNLLHLHSREAAANYLVEFEEMFEEGRFGMASVMDTPYPRLSLTNVDVEVYFSPDDMAAVQIVELLDAAQDRIVILAYSLTLDPIADAICGRIEGGVHVEGVIDSGQAANTGSDVDRLVRAGADLLLDGNADKMHHKVIIVDDAIVITGSYNFSRSAEERNDENLLIIYSQELAEAYLEEYARIRALAAP